MAEPKTETKTSGATVPMVRVTVDGSAQNEIVAELIASDIAAIASALRRVEQSRLNRRALVLLVQDACVNRIGKDAVNDVLNAVSTLDKNFLKPAQVAAAEKRSGR